MDPELKQALLILVCALTELVKVVTQKAKESD